jgi:hypothetical protein
MAIEENRFEKIWKTIVLTWIVILEQEKKKRFLL